MRILVWKFWQSLLLRRKSISKSLFFILLLSLLISHVLYAEPGNSLIKKEVAIEIQKEIEKNKNYQFITGFIKHFFQPVSWLGYLFGSILFAAIIIILIFILFQTLSYRRSEISRIHKLEKEHKETRYDAGYLENLEANKDYSKAIVYIHKCTIFYFLASKLTYKKNLTNLSFYRLIKNKELKKAFRYIYYSRVHTF